MTADRELDALMAEKVMGWRRMSWKDYHSYMNFNGTDEREEFTYAWHDADGNMTEAHVKDELYYENPTPPWSPSEEIADAWLAVEKLTKAISINHYFRIGVGAISWECEFCQFNPNNNKETILGKAIEDTAPLAICLAALKAVENHES